MPTTPSMFDSVDTIYTLVRIAHPEPDSDTRIVEVTVQMGQKSKRFSHKIPVDRYSPESSVIRAVAAALGDLERHQGTIGREVIGAILGEQFRMYVEPF